MEEQQIQEKVESLSSQKKMALLRNFLLGIVVSLGIACLIFYAYSYSGVRKMSTNSAVLFGAKVFYLPVAKINNSKILYNDYIDIYSSLRRFYKNNENVGATPSDEDAKMQAVSKLLVENLIKQEAKRYDVKLTNDDLKIAKDDLIKNFKDEAEAKQEVQKMYGWTLDQFLQNFSYPAKFEEKFQKVFEESVDETGKEFSEEQVKASHILFMVQDEKKDAEIKKKAEEVLERIKKGEDFATLAKEFGSDGTKETGGDLGWFSKGMMVPEFEEAVFALDKGALGQELVKTQFGYHIVKVSDKRNAKNFGAYMDNALRKARVEMIGDLKNPFASFLAQEQQQAQQPEEEQIQLTEEEQAQIQQ